MCILFFYINSRPRKGQYRFILASNRDEYFQRLSKPVHKWSVDETVIAGQDMEGGFEGGTWLGASTQNSAQFRFRIGCLLNLTGETRTKGAPGRGAIVSDFLLGSQSAEEYVSKLFTEDVAYNAFNFVSVQLSEQEGKTFYYTNRPNTSVAISGEEFFGFGNSLVAVPLRKVVAGKKRFQSIVENYPELEKSDLLINELLDLLKWDEKHLPDEELKRRAEFAHEFLSSCFVSIEQASYGTRAHSVVLVDYDWNVEFVEDAMEQPYKPDDCKWSRVSVKTKA